MAQEQTIVTVFLGTSAELEDDRVLMGDFFGELNQLTADRGAYFRLVRWRWDGRNDPLRDYDALVRESALCVFLFLTSGGPEMERRFGMALEAFRSHGAPQIVTWFRSLPDGRALTAELEAFRTRLDQQLHHFYNTYETIDSVKLGLLLQVARSMDLRSGWQGEKDHGQVPSWSLGTMLPGMPAAGTLPLGAATSQPAGSDVMGLQIKGDEVCLWGTPVMSLAAVPAYAGWQRLHAQRAELDALEPTYQRLRARTLEDPGDQAARDALLGISLRREELGKSIDLAQRRFLEFMADMSRRTVQGAGELTERQRQAYRLVNRGMVEEAIAILDAEEIRRDRDRAERDLMALEASREAALARLRSHVSEQVQLAELLESQPGEKNAERAAALLRDAADCERAHALGYRAQMRLAGLLVDEMRLTEARTCLLGALSQIEPMTHGCSDEVASDFGSIVGQLLEVCLSLGDAETARRAGESRVSFLREERPDWDLALAAALRGLGRALTRLGEYAPARRSLTEALEILPEKTSTYHTSVLREKATVLESLAELIVREGDFEGGEHAQARALKLRLTAARRKDADDEDQVRLAWSMTACGSILFLRDGGSPRRALKAYEANVGRCRALAKGRDPDRLSLLAYTLLQMSQVMVIADQSDAALEAANESLDIYQGLYEIEPRAFACNYVNAICAVSALLATNDRFDEAESLLLRGSCLVAPFAEERPETYGLFRLLCDYALLEVRSIRGDDGLLEAARTAVGEAERLMGYLPTAVEYLYVSLLTELADAEDCPEQEAVDALARAERVARGAVQAGRDTLRGPLAEALCELGRAHAEGDPRRAASEFAEARDLLEGLAADSPDLYMGTLASCVDGLVRLAKGEGAWDEVLRVRTEELGLFERVGSGFEAWWVTEALWDVGEAQVELDRLAEATATFIDLEERCREEGDGEVLLACWENLGLLCGLQGLWREAATAYEVALDVAADVGADDGTIDELRAELARARSAAEG